jgi:pyruvate-formate lyase
MGMNIHPSVLETIEGVNRLCDMIKYYVANGGRYIQFNVVSRETLLDARKNPEKYRDLMVNTGNNHWSYYVQLHKEVQDRLILRTEHKKI